MRNVEPVFKARGSEYSRIKLVITSILETAGLLFLKIRPTRRSARRARFLVMEPFGLGDLIATTSLVRQLRSHFPESTIDLVCHSRWAEFAQRLPGIDRVRHHPFFWSDSRKRLTVGKAVALLGFIRELRRDRYDCGFDVRGDIRSQLLLAGAGIPERIGHSDYMGANLRTRRLLTVAVPCGIRPRLEEMESLFLALGVPSREPMAMDLGTFSRNASGAQRRIGVHLGASWRFRKWPADKCVRLLDALSKRSDATITLIGAAPEAEELRAIAEQVAQPPEIVITPTPWDLVTRIAQQDLLVCLDSAPLHIAVATGIPVVALFGPGQMRRWAHQRQNVVYVHHQDRFACAPCDQLRCVFPKHNCMASIEFEEVLRPIAAFLDSSAKPGAIV